MALDIDPGDATLGATVRGVDLRQPLDGPTFAKIESAWHDHAVLIFPEQHLSHDQHQDFSRMFGPLELSIRRNRPKSAGQLTNVRADGTIAPPESLQARFLLGNTFWHTDSSYKRVGAKASILAAHVVPDSGGGSAHRRDPGPPHQRPHDFILCQYPGRL